LIPREPLKRQGLRRGTAKCYPWTGFIAKNGYGMIHVKRHHKEYNLIAHRVIYEGVFGPIPEGMTVDHICRNRACVNPSHMRLLTSRENTLCGFSPSALNARKTHCKRGHELSGYNLICKKSGGLRRCRTCHNLMRSKRKPEAIANA